MPEAIWPYVCQLYQQPSVSDACLRLQDQQAINVPLLLFCCWASRSYGALTTDTLQECRRISQSFSEAAVKPLRNLRRSMKVNDSSDWAISQTDWESLREQVKAAELQSERLLLEALASCCTGENELAGSIDHCLRCLSVCFDRQQLAAGAADLAMVLNAAFSEAFIDEIYIRNSLATVAAP